MSAPLATTAAGTTPTPDYAAIKGAAAVDLGQRRLRHRRLADRLSG